MIYTVPNESGKPYHTANNFDAIQQAKAKAKADKQKVTIYRNGLPYAMVDRKGNLVSA